MRKLAFLIVAILGFGVIAFAQTYMGPPNPTALVCAYNTVAPTPVAGQFYYIQCDSTGKIIVQ